MGVGAEVTLDGTLGPSGTLAGPDVVVQDTDGALLGTNLFHSFSQFDVGASESVTFTGPDAIDNVIGRVTGSNASGIDGAIVSSIVSANLWFINPNGIVIGPSASIAVDGSFHVSSASYVRFSDGAHFDARLPGSSTLTAAAPHAFGFLDADLQTVNMQGPAVDLAGGATLSVVGHSIAVRDGAALSSPGGRIALVATGGPGEVPVADGAGLDGAPHAGAMLVEQSSISTSGEGGSGIHIRAGEFVIAGAVIESVQSGATGGGGVDIRAETFAMSDSAAIVSGGFGSGTPGAVNIKAQHVSIIGSALESPGIVSIGDAPQFAGIRIEAGTLELKGLASIVTDYEGSGRGADLSIDADSLEIDGNDLFSADNIATHKSGAGSGASGDVFIRADTLALINGGLIRTVQGGEGSSGRIDIVASDLFLAGNDPGVTTGIESFGTNGVGGSSGPITVRADDIRIVNGATISSFAFGTGSTGRIEVRGDTIDIRGAQNTLTGIIAFSQTASARSSDIAVEARDLSLNDGAYLGTAALGSGDTGNVSVRASRLELAGGTDPAGTFIFSSSFDVGNAGNLFIDADTITVQDGGLIDSSSEIDSSGRGGTVSVHANSLTMIDSLATPRATGIASNARGSGAGGTIVVDVDALALRSGASIQAVTTGPAPAGNIEVHARSVSIVGEQSDLGASLTGVSTESLGSGDAGNIRMTVATMDIERNAGLSAVTHGAGRGGNIEVVANNLTIYGDGASAGISTNSLGGGDGGGIELRTDRLGVFNGGFITAGATADGAGGAILINSASISILGNDSAIDVSASGRGSAGDITIRTGTLDIASDGGTTGISSASFDTGSGGRIMVEAGQIALVSGGSITAGASDVGDGGAIRITADSLRISGNGSKIDVGSTGQGNAGDIRIQAGTIGLDTRGQIASSTSATPGGTGGSIAIAADRLTLAGGARIVADSAGSGVAGDIDINLASTFESIDSEIATTAADADGGNIRLNATSLVYLRHGVISTSVGGGLGAGGNITIDPVFVILNDSVISADAFGGPGGRIQITASHFIADDGSSVHASSQLGIDGTVEIFAPDTDVAASLAVLTGSYLDASALLSSHCRTSAVAASSLAQASTVAESSPDALLVSDRRGAEPAPVLMAACR